MTEIEGEAFEVGEVMDAIPSNGVEPIDREGVLAVTKTSYLGLTGEEMRWAALAHGSILIALLLGIVTGGMGAIIAVAIPAAIWYVYRDRSVYVVEQARQAAVFQLAGFVALLALAIGGTLLVVVGWTVSGVLTIVLVGLILMPIMILLTLLLVVALVALPIAMVVYGCYAAVETHNGRPFRYRWVDDLIQRYQAQA